MSQNCPFTGKPCDKPPQASLKVSTPHGTNVVRCCEDCAAKLTAPFAPLMPQPEPTPPPAPTPGPGMAMFPLHLLGQNPLVSAMNAVLYGIAAKAAQQQTESPACSGCGRTLHELYQGAKLGCPRCYDDLGPYLKQAMPAMHEGADAHHKDAKRPKEGSVKRLGNDLLKAQLEKAIKEERYEDAASIRDELRARGAIADPAKLKELEMLMAGAVKEERYEDAAKFRDEIKALKGLS